MAQLNRENPSLYDEAKSELGSLVKQTAQVFAGLVVMLIISSGNPSGIAIGFSFLIGTSFVAWSEKNSRSKFKSEIVNYSESTETEKSLTRITRFRAKQKYAELGQVRQSKPGSAETEKSLTRMTRLRAKQKYTELGQVKQSKTEIRYSAMGHPKETVESASRSVNFDLHSRQKWFSIISFLASSVITIYFIYSLSFLVEQDFGQVSHIVNVIYVHVSNSSGNLFTQKEICSNLLKGDLAINLDLSDYPNEPSIQIIDTSSGLTQKCQTLFNNARAIRNKEINLSLTMNRIQNAIATERLSGNRNPVVVTMWLYDAVVPTSSVFKDFQQQVESIVRDRGTVIIFTTGKLREILKERFNRNPDVHLCPINSRSCILETFQEAREVEYFRLKIEKIKSMPKIGTEE